MVMLKIKRKNLKFSDSFDKIIVFFLPLVFFLFFYFHWFCFYEIIVFKSEKNSVLKVLPIELDQAFKTNSLDKIKIEIAGFFKNKNFKLRNIEKLNFSNKKQRVKNKMPPKLPHTDA